MDADRPGPAAHRGPPVDDVDVHSARAQVGGEGQAHGPRADDEHLRHRAHPPRREHPRRAPAQTARTRNGAGVDTCHGDPSAAASSGAR